MHRDLSIGNVLLTKELTYDDDFIPEAMKRFGDSPIVFKQRTLDTTEDGVLHDLDMAGTVHPTPPMETSAGSFNNELEPIDESEPDESISNDESRSDDESKSNDNSQFDDKVVPNDEPEFGEDIIMHDPPLEDSVVETQSHWKGFRVVRCSCLSGGLVLDWLGTGRAHRRSWPWIC